MSRVSSFLFGMVFGASALYLSMHYYVVHSSDGLHPIAKLTPCLGNPYVDVRKFTVSDWQKHHELAMASVRANKGKMVQETPAARPNILRQSSTHASAKISDNANW